MVDMRTDTPKKKVLVLGTVEHAKNELKKLEKAALEVLQIEKSLPPTDDELETEEEAKKKKAGEEEKEKIRARFLKEIANEKYKDVEIICRTFASVSITGIFDAELIEALATHLPKLKFICHNGAGYDQVKIDPCSEKDIFVSNVPTAVDDATADVNMFLILGALRNFNLGMTTLRKGEWNKGVPLGHDPQGKVLGILGMGGIGRNLRDKAKAFGMEIIYHSRNRIVSGKEEGDAEYVSFDELLARSDVLSINCPLNQKTKCLIGKEQFEKMKDGIVIVNTARGAIVDEKELVKALESGKVRSVGLDVYENEPQIEQGLLDNPNVMLVPHMGTHTEETQYKMEKWWLSNAIEAAKNGKLVSPVSEQRDKYAGYISSLQEKKAGL